MNTLRWNTLQEAAHYLTAQTREQWTPRRIIDAGEQGLVNVQAVLPKGTQTFTDDAQIIFTGNTVDLEGVYLDYLLMHDSVFVRGTTNREDVSVNLKPPATFTHADLGITGRDLEAFALAIAATPVKAEVNTTPSDDIPGKLPNTNIGQLAIKAAWQIECATGKGATAKQVIETLKKWEPGEPVITESIAHGVKWATTKGTEKSFDVETCAKTLKTWNVSRA